MLLKNDCFGVYVCVFLLELTLITMTLTTEEMVCYKCHNVIQKLIYLGINKTNKCQVSCFMLQIPQFFFSADLGSTECEVAEDQVSFAQPAIVQPEIDIEVSEVCYVISISEFGLDSKWKKTQCITDILKKVLKSLNNVVFPSWL